MIKYVIEIISNCNTEDEEKYFDIYVTKYGLKNIRLGSFISNISNITTNIITNIKNHKTIKSNDSSTIYDFRHDIDF